MSENIRIPNGWKSIKLGNILKIETGSKNAEDASLDGIYPFFTRAEETQKIDTYSYDTEALFIAGEGNFRVKYYKGKFEAHQRTYVLTPKNEDIDLSYLQKAIQPKITRLISTSVGSTVMSLRKPQIAEIDVLAPKLKGEQQKIAEVLGEIDNAISKTEELFEKNKRIKTALMQDLLSYGIDENGKIRHPQTHKFIPSALGNIPDGWNCIELEKVAFLQRGYDLPNSFRKEGKYKVYGSNGIDGYHDHYAVKAPTIITGRSGTIGKVHYEENDCWPLNTTLYVKNFYKNEPKFIKSLLEQLDLKSFSASTGVPSLNRNFVHPVKVKLPKDIKEQKAIAQILSSQDEKIEDIKNKLNKLKSLKASLMQDLLCGRKRVTKLMEENL